LPPLGVTRFVTLCARCRCSHTCQPRLPASAPRVRTREQRQLLPQANRVCADGDAAQRDVGGHSAHRRSGRGGTGTRARTLPCWGTRTQHCALPPSRGSHPCRSTRRALAWLALLAAACSRATAPGPAPSSTRPERIVALTIGAVDTLDLLGELHRAIAVEADCFVPGTEQLVRIRNDDHSGPSQALNVEAVIALHPDLVIAKADLRPVLGDRGLQVLWVPVCSDLETVMQTVSLIGERIGVADTARTVVTAMRAQIASLQQRARSLPAVRVYYEAGRPGRTTGKGTLMDDLIRLAGGQNIAADVAMANPSFSTEAILAANPQVIVLSPWSDPPATVAARPGWSRLAAVRDQRLHQIAERHRDLQSPSPRCLAACEAELLPWLHPELAPPTGR
jgi:iron complex transport system substrate-binding protein